jgi:hypothetical protein
MAIAQRWAVRNVAKATMYDATTGKMIAYLESLKTSGLTTASTTVYARGGDGNPKLVGFSSDKEVKVNLSSAIFDNRAMALLTGNAMSTAAKEIYKREIVASVEADTLTLTNTPVGDPLGVYLYGTDGVEGAEYTKVASLPTETEYSITGKVITLNAATVVGTQFVVYYKVTTAATAQTITVSSNAFPAAFKLVMEVLITDFATKALYPAQIIIPSCKMEDNWEFSFAPDGEPAPLNLPIEVLKPANSNDMFTMTIYDSATVV